jgi:hypothetical protein
MRHSRVPWVTKLRPDLEPKLVPNPYGAGYMLVPTPLVVAEELRKVRRGGLVTPAHLRERLAKRFGAAMTCPLTTGIFINILAGAAEEDLAAGRRVTAPYWRVVDDQCRLSEKTPPGPVRQAARLRSEGHRVVKRGGRWQVALPSSDK